ncbi:energy transducer TonB [Pseudomonas sp. JDS28PS106]
MFMAFMSLPAVAAQGVLIPVFTPTPEYPPELIELRYPGKVRALLTIKSDGTVVEVKSLESSHPLLTQTVERTLRQWRYKPWAGTVGAPLRIAVTLPLIFGSEGMQRFNRDINVGLGNIQCAYLNYEVGTHRLNSPGAPLSKVDLFWYTGQFLFSSYAALQLGEEQRTALLGQLEQAMPSIIAGCEQHPERRYGDFLPAGIKALMVSAAEPGEGA